MSVGLSPRQRSNNSSNRCSGTSRRNRVTGATTSRIAVANSCPVESVHFPSRTRSFSPARFSRTATCTVKTALTGKPLSTCTAVERTEDPGPGRADPTSAVSIAVIIPAVSCVSPASTSTPALSKALAHARMSRDCKVRDIDAVSPSLTSSNVLL